MVRRLGARRIAAILSIVGLLAAPGLVLAQDIQPTPQVAEGFTIAPLAAIPAPTAITFGPDLPGMLPSVQVDGPGDLYAATLTGTIYRLDLTWTPAGPIAGELTTFAEGFSQPLGIAFDDEGIAYVSDSTAAEVAGRAADGIVYWIDEDGQAQALVENLPNGRHNTNQLAFGPDGKLYIPNGNPNDSGPASGAADVFPYSGAILAVDADALREDPAVLEWRDGQGELIPPDQIASHPSNTDFADKVEVVGYGFRNVYDVAFGADGTPYTATNGADVPPSQDALYRLDAPAGTFHGFPFCYNEGPAGATDGIEKVRNPVFEGQSVPEVPGGDCSNTPTADALIGWHVCATGMDISVPGQQPSGLVAGFGHAAYIAECGPFFPDDVANKTLANPTTHNTGHKVVRVDLDESGSPTGVRDFVTGLALPTDAAFGPDGALYIASAEGVHRVAPAGAGLAS